MEELIWGRRIRAFRKLKGYTQEEFAKLICVSVSVLGEIERGTRKPEDDILLSVVTTLGVTYEELTSIN
ncbi:transcriptional regulator [Salipaludibacillus neizhouensis]|uniref:Transcriptional regulator n=1 Tax=Salipaludibacillus neizhouensis TaxID=885475 RepID=A0A3A9KCV7_9BACI|nr:helix-turn-helix transcriptional regulator [Salipaludibacillus neizhouensis]RKL65235.1 transcriptional regulator [Salipaludibacillus neizhouensis]